MTSRLLIAWAMLSVCAGCSFHARGANEYRDAVRGLLEQRRASVENCYKQAHDQDQSLAGKVVVRFDVEPKTGAVTNAKVVPASTDAPEPLQACVMQSLEGLQLQPPDQRQGDATFTWAFEPQSLPQG